LRRGAGFATLARVSGPRVVCDGLRLAREEVFDAFRLMPAALFLVRRRVFSATALAWVSRLFWRFLENAPEKSVAGRADRHIGGVLHYETPI